MQTLPDSMDIDTTPKTVPVPRIRSSAATGAMLWIAGSFFVSQALVFVQGMFAARYLDAIGLGVWGIATVINNLYRGFTQSASPQDFVVLSPDDQEQSVLQSAFFANIIRSAVLGLAFLALGPVLAAFYDQRVFIGVMALFAVGIGLDGLRNPGLGLAVKRFDFKPMVLAERGSQIIGLVLSLGLLVIYRNIWAVIVPLVLARILFVVVSYFYEPIRPRWSLVRVAWLRPALAFAFYMTSIVLLSIAVRQGPDFFIGRFEGLEVYGKYSVLYLIASLPVNGITYVIDHLTFPIYSKYKGIPARQGEALGSIQFTVFLATSLLTMVFFIGTGPLLDLLPGTDWAGYGTIFRLLVIYSFARSLAGTYGAICKAYPRLQQRLNLVTLGEMLFLAVFGLPVLARWGLEPFIVIMTLGILLSASLLTGLIQPYIVREPWLRYRWRIVLTLGLLAAVAVLYLALVGDSGAALPGVILIGGVAGFGMLALHFRPIRQSLGFIAGSVSRH